jgi:PST family polysaccharide transporter
LKLIKTSFFSAIITFIRIAAGFVAGKVIALFTGPAGVALIGQFTNFITIILTFANGAINSGVIKYTAEFKDDEVQLKKLFSTSLKISVYCSGIFGVLLLIVASYISQFLFHSSLYCNPIRVLGITIILYSLNSLLIAILNGLQQIKKYTLVNTAGSIIGLLFTVILVFYFKILGALYALVLTQSIVFFVTLVLIIKSDWFSWSFFKQPFDKETAKKLSHYTLMAITTTLCMPIAQIVLRNLVIEKFGVNSAGYWQGMMRISDGYLMLITTSLSTYYLPKLASLNGNRELRKEILQGYKIILPLVFISCLSIYILRFYIIKILFTEEFNTMSELFLFQLIGDFFKIAAWILAFLMVAKSMTKIFIITEIIFTFNYVLLSHICISLFKLKGLTIAFAINYFLYLIVMIILFRNLLFNHKDEN